MKQKLRRLLAVLVAAMMLISALPVDALAAIIKDTSDSVSPFESAIAPINIVDPDQGQYGEYQFLDRDGNELEKYKQSVPAGDTVIVPPAPTVDDGEMFMGWYEEGGARFESPYISVAGQHTYKAKVEPIHYVFFHDEYGNVYETVEALPEGYTVAELPEYTPDKGAFDKWVIGSKGGTEEFTTNTYVESNTLDVYPTVTEKYWVTYNTLGANEQIDSEQVAPGESVNPNDKASAGGYWSDPDLTRLGYTFAGWSTALNADGTSGDANHQVNGEVQINEDTTFYAIWTPANVNYTVVYWGESASADPAPADDLSGEGATYAVDMLYSVVKQANTGTKIDATNKQYAPDLTNTNYSDAKYFQRDDERNGTSSITVAPDGSSVLNVYYTRKIYTLKFTWENGSQWVGSYWDEWNRVQGHYETVERKLTIGTETYTAAQGYSLDVKYGMAIGDLWPTASDFNVDNFYAWNTNWVSKRPIVTADMLPNTGTENTFMASFQSGKGIELHYMLENADDDGYTDSPLYRQSAVTNGGFDPKELFGFEKSYKTEEKTENRKTNYYFYYERKTFTLKLNNAGVETTHNGIKYEASLDKYLRQPERPAGYSENAVFIGWYEVPPDEVVYDPANPNAGTPKYTGGTMPAANMELFAYWYTPEKKVSISVTIDGKEQTWDITVPEGESIAQQEEFKQAQAMADATNSFLYWADENGNQVNVNEPLYHDVSITAVFVDVNQYKVTYTPGEGTGTNIVDQRDYRNHDGSAAEAIPFPDSFTEPTDKEFAYWMDANGVVYYPGQEVPITGNVVLTAQYVSSPLRPEVHYHANWPAGTGNPSSEVYVDQRTVLAYFKYTILGLTATGIPTPSGYTFQGWCEDKAGTGTKYKSGDEVRIDDKDTDLYAVWQRDKGTLIVKKVVMDGEQESTDKSQQFTISVTQTRSDAQPEADWKAESIQLSAGESHTYTNVPTGDFSVNETTPEGYTVSYNPPSGTLTKDNELELTVINTKNNPSLSVTKTVTSEHPEGGYKPGDTISYSITVHNDGNVTLKNIDVTDNKTGGNWTINSLAPNATETFATSYTVQEGDLGTDDLGSFTNTATATATFDGETVTDSGEATVSTAKRNPGLTTTKTLTNANEATGKDGKFKKGDTAKFDIVVKNTGNTTQHNVVVTETMPGAKIVSGDGYTVNEAGTEATIGAIAPGDSVTVKAEYTITQDDIDNQTALKNTATVGGEGSTGPDPVPVPTEDKKPGLTAEKTLTNGKNEDGSEHKFAAGETATFDIVVKNTGNTTQHDVVVTEQLSGAKIVGGDGYTVNADGTATIPTIEVGKSVTVKAEYTITQADIDSDAELKNVALVKGDGDTTAPDPVTIPEEPKNPGLTVNKKASPTNGLKEGDSIHYTITVTNSGNVTLYDIDVQDELVDNLFVQQMFGDYEFPTELAPKESFTLDALYTVTAADVAAGIVTNVATATGYTSETHTDADEPVTATGDATSNTTGTQGLTIFKEVYNGGKDFQKGDTIMFRVWVENTGDVTLENVVVTDPLPGAKIEDSHDGAYTTDNNEQTATFDELKPGERQFVRVTYEVQQSDVDAGLVRNTASAKADNYPGSDDPSTSVVVDIPQHPGLTSTKTLTNEGSGDNGAFNANETATFDITVTNSGNTTQKNVVVTDTLTDAEIVEGEGYTINESGNAVIGEMAPGATVTVKAIYTVTQADIDSDADLKNTATVKGEDGTEPETPPEVEIPEVPKTPGLTATKTVTNSGSGENGTFKAGETATFDITITNSGNTTQTNVTVTEQLAGATIVEGNGYTVNEDGTATIPTIEVGKSVTVKAQYTVTQDDIESGETLQNIAKVDGDNGTEPDPTPEVDIPEVAQKPALTVTKAIESNYDGHPYALGETIRYRVTVTNSGNVTLNNVVVHDEKLTPVHNADFGGAVLNVSVEPAVGYHYAEGDNLTLDEMAPNATYVIEYGYQVTENDILKGHVDNTATAIATNPGASGFATAMANTAEPNPVLTVEKTASGPNPAKVGDTITYTITVTNNGNVTVSNITVTDPLTKLNQPIDSLAPGASAEVTTTYTVTEDDILAGKIENTATATGKDPNDKDVTGSDTETVTDEPDPDEPDKPVLDKPTPALTVEKTASGPNPAKLDDKITYTITVTNSGNVTVSDISVTDSKTGESWTIESLAPNASEMFTTTYTVTEADILAGSIANTATATGKDPDGNPVENSDTETVTDEPDPDEPDKPVLDTPRGSLSVTKEVESNIAGHAYGLGDIITYQIIVMNDGNVTLSNVTLDDRLLPDSPVDISITSEPSIAAQLVDGKLVLGEMKPGKRIIINYTYQVTEDDILAGKVENTATATGTDPNGNSVERSDSADATTAPKNGHLTVTKTTTSTPADGSAYALGETITYSVTVTNDGNLTITGITVTDELTGNKGENAWTIESLEPGAHETFTAEYVVTEEDIKAGHVMNEATATGTSPDPDTPDVPVDPGKVDEPTQKPAPSLFVDKTADKTDGVKLGDTVTYTITVTNNGNVTVSDITVTDPKTGLNETIDSLAPGGSEEYTTTHTITEEDILAGSFVNTATATGTDPNGEQVTGTDDETVMTADRNPQLAVTKTVLNSNTGYDFGDTVTYHITVENTGNLTLNDVKLEDTLTGSEFFSDASCETDASIANKTLEPGEQFDVYTKYTVTEADIQKGGVENIATATGTDPNGDEVKAEDSVTVTTVGQNPALTSTKMLTNSGADGAFKANETAEFDIVVENTGNTTQTSVTVADTLNGATLTGGYTVMPDGAATVSITEGGTSATITDMAPGAKVTVKAEYTVTQTDIDNGTELANTATVDGEGTTPDPDPEPIPTEDQNPGLTTTKKLMNSGSGENGAFKAGETAEFDIVVENSGNTTQKSVVVTEMMWGAKIVAGEGYDVDEPGKTATIDEIPVGGSVTVKAEYTVTQDDIDKGRELANTATVNGDGTTPDPEPEPIPTDAQAPRLMVRKTVRGLTNTGFKLGDTVIFHVVVTNNGNVTLSKVNVTDELTKSWFSARPDNEFYHVDLPVDLAPGETIDVYTRYTVTEADILKGEIENIAVATGTDPNGETVEGSDNAIVYPEQPNGHVTITKTTTSTPEEGGTYALGETITYEITATNDGNLTLTNVVVTDELTGDTWTIESLEPGASETFTAEYVVTEADILAGKVVNEATATGTSPDPHEPNVPVEPGEKEDPTDPPKSGLTSTKTLTSIGTGENGAFKADDIATFDITVKNSGNTTQTNVTVTEQLTGATIVEGEGYTIVDGKAVIESMDPGAVVVVKATYTVTQKDIDSDAELKNVALVKGDNGEEPDPTPEVEIPEEEKKPGLTTSKTVTNAPAGGFKAGETAEFNITVTNSGNTTQTNVTVTEQLAGATIVEGDGYEIVNGQAVIAEMDPGAEVVVKATYTVTQADIDSNAQLRNVALVDGDNDPTDPTPGVDIPEEPRTPGLTTTKRLTNSGTGEKGAFKAGETATFTITVENTGNTTQTNVTVTEGLSGAVIVAGTGYTVNAAGQAVIAEMAPGAKVVVNATYTVTEADISNNRALYNTVTVGGEGTKTGPDPVPVPHEIPQPSLSSTKTLTNRGSGANGAFKAGETATFDIVVTNTGNTTQPRVVVNEMPGARIVAGTGYTVSGNSAIITNMIPGATVTVQATYTVTQADIDSDTPLRNIATVSGGGSTDPDPEPIPEEEKNPSLTTTKTLTNAGSGANGAFKAGETATFDITVRNTGNTTQTNIVVTEGMSDARILSGAGYTVNAQGQAVITSIAPGAAVVVRATYTITQEDIDTQRQIVNTATVSGGEGDKTDPDPVPVPEEQPNPGLTSTKVLSNAGTGANGAFRAGETAQFTITVTNTGNTTQENVVVRDTMAGATIVAGSGYTLNADGSATIATMQPGDSVRITATYTVTQRDIETNAQLANTATVDGEGDTPDPDPAVIPHETPNPALTVAKTAPAGPYGAGDTITYTITVSNTGNVTVTNIAVTDPLTGMNQTIASLAPGATQTFTTTHNVTNAEVNAGRVVNTATATGSDPSGNPVTGEDSVEVEARAMVQLTVRYWFDAIGGETASPTFIRHYFVGSSYSVTSPRLAGYTCNLPVVSGTIVRNTILNVIYTGTDYTLTVTYVYEDGTTAAPTVQQTVNAGSRYSVTSPTIAGYTPNYTVVAGTMPARNVNYTVIYVPNETEILIDEYGVPLNIGNVTMNVGDCFE